MKVLEENIGAVISVLDFHGEILSSGMNTTRSEQYEIRRTSLKTAICVHQRTVSRKQRGNIYKISIIGKSTQIERRLVVRQPKGGRMESHGLMVTVCLRGDEDKIMA